MPEARHGASPTPVAEAVLFPVDDHAIPFTAGLKLELVSAKETRSRPACGMLREPGRLRSVPAGGAQVHLAHKARVVQRVVDPEATHVDAELRGEAVDLGVVPVAEEHGGELKRNSVERVRRDAE